MTSSVMKLITTSTKGRASYCRKKIICSGSLTNGTLEITHAMPCIPWLPTKLYTHVSYSWGNVRSTQLRWRNTLTLFLQRTARYASSFLARWERVIKTFASFLRCLLWDSFRDFLASMQPATLRNNTHDALLLPLGIALALEESAYYCALESCFRIQAVFGPKPRNHRRIHLHIIGLSWLELFLINPPLWSVRLFSGLEDKHSCATALRGVM